jgi:hypothetical protein
MLDRLPEALDIVVGRTRAERYRQLCDPTHPAYNPDYVPVVLRLAGFLPPEGPPPPAAVIPPQAPGLLTKAVNFATAVAGHVAAGMPEATPELKAARLAVCSTCDQRLPGGVCAGCGCDLDRKASWRDQDCPLGKWPVTPT